MNPAAVGHLSQGLLEWVGRTSLHGTVLIVLVLLTQLLFGRVLPARWRYAPWLLVVLRLLMPVAPASSMSIFNLGNRVLHVGVVSDRATGPTPLIIHNIGSGVKEEDILLKYRVIGHYRIREGAEPLSSPRGQ